MSVIRVYLKFVLLLMSVFSLSGCLPTIFVGAAGTTMEFAKDRTAGDTITDARISTSIKATLMKKDFRNLYSKIKVEVVQGRVLLSGSIDKKEDAVTAVSVAWDQKGVVDVINELQLDKNSNKFDIVQYTRDSLITSQIKSKIFLNREIKFVNYTVITNNDVVYLFGISRSEEELEQVAKIASGIRGVKRVVSHMKVQRLARKVTPKFNKLSTHHNNEKQSTDEDDDLTLEKMNNDW